MGDNIRAARSKMRAADDMSRIRIDDPRWLASEFKRMSKAIVEDEFVGPGDTLVAAADRIAIHHHIDPEIILQGWKRPPRNTLVTRWMALFRVYHERGLAAAAAYEEKRYEAEKAGVSPAILRLADLVAGHTDTSKKIDGA
jgi:hypothetical protein